MNAMEDASRAALNREEGALLPALPQKRGIAGKIALRERIEMAKRMQAMRLNGEFHALVGQVRQAEEAQKHQGRAALHQVLRP